MKKQTFTIAAAFLFSIQSKAQNTINPNSVPQANIPPRTVVQQPNVPVHIFNVSNVTLSVDSAVYAPGGAGATKNYFKATINSVGTGTVQYKWILIVPGIGAGGQPIPPSVVSGSLQLNGSGTDLLFTERAHVTHNPQRTLKLEITSPTTLQSNTITF